MATGPGVNQGKTAFLEDFLPGDPDADFTAVNRAWKAAGNEGSVSESLVSKARSRLKLDRQAGARRGADRATAKPAAKGKAKSSPKGARARGRPRQRKPRRSPKVGREARGR